MKNKIKEVQDYFRNRILKGEFKITKCDDGIVDVDIDGAFFQLHLMKRHRVVSIFHGVEQHFVKLEAFNELEESESYVKLSQKICDLDN